MVSTASYTRRDSTASGIAGSAVLDAISLRTTWEITELWDAAFRADWTHRASTSPVDQLVRVVNSTRGRRCQSHPGRGVRLGGDLLRRGDRLQCLLFLPAGRPVDRYHPLGGPGPDPPPDFTRNLSSGLRYTFNRQTSEANTAGGFSDFDDHLITLNVQYDFDRWNIW